jgi:hypothetical protein
MQAFVNSRIELRRMEIKRLENRHSEKAEDETLPCAQEVGVCSSTAQEQELNDAVRQCLQLQMQSSGATGLGHQSGSRGTSRGSVVQRCHVVMDERERG